MLFTPCLLFPGVAFSLDPQKLKELWIIPIIFVVITSVSAAVGWIMGTMLGLRGSQRNFGVAASMFQNTNSLPIALMQSLVVTVQDLKWGSDDNKNAMIGRVLGYLVFYSALSMMVCAISGTPIFPLLVSLLLFLLVGSMVVRSSPACARTPRSQATYN